MDEDERIAREQLLILLGEANDMWPLFIGHPTTGEPIELAREQFERIKAALRESINGPAHTR